MLSMLLLIFLSQVPGQGCQCEECFCEKCECVNCSTSNNRLACLVDPNYADLVTVMLRRCGHAAYAAALEQQRAGTDRGAPELWNLQAWRSACRYAGADPAVLKNILLGD